MTSSTWSDRLARAFAFLRGAMLVLFSALLIIAPEKAMPGSSMEPARSLALVFASRTILLGVVLAVLALQHKRQALRGFSSPMPPSRFSIPAWRSP